MSPRNQTSITKYQETHTTFALSVLNKKIKILEKGWVLISQFKHKQEFDHLNINFEDLTQTLTNADVVFKSKKHKQVFLYYKKINHKHLCVVCRHYNSTGFLITCYPEDRPKGAKKVWPKRQLRKKINLK